MLDKHGHSTKHGLDTGQLDAGQWTLDSWTLDNGHWTVGLEMQKLSENEKLTFYCFANCSSGIFR